MALRSYEIGGAGFVLVDESFKPPRWQEVIMLDRTDGGMTLGVNEAAIGRGGHACRLDHSVVRRSSVRPGASKFDANHDSSPACGTAPGNGPDRAGASVLRTRGRRPVVDFGSRGFDPKDAKIQQLEAQVRELKLLMEKAVLDRNRRHCVDSESEEEEPEEDRDDFPSDLQNVPLIQILSGGLSRAKELKRNGGIDRDARRDAGLSTAPGPKQSNPEQESRSTSSSRFPFVREAEGSETTGRREQSGQSVLAEDLARLRGMASGSADPGASIISNLISLEILKLLEARKGKGKKSKRGDSDESVSEEDSEKDFLKGSAKAMRTYHDHGKTMRRRPLKVVREYAEEGRREVGAEEDQPFQIMDITKQVPWGRIAQDPAQVPLHDQHSASPSLEEGARRSCATVCAQPSCGEASSLERRIVEDGLVVGALGGSEISTKLRRCRKGLGDHLELPERAGGAGERTARVNPFNAGGGDDKKEDAKKKT
eukprot:TRINITY_DN41399_c0_g1_i1.p1 TRINITY_DN41399_c0_g1~~TRINITY_DN41399_c0_g1_i1.p1  ORF type:complete len:483 (+),score=73.77 TRINITY_DN41399_c0_g1_i1:386-1834(+)